MRLRRSLLSNFGLYLWCAYRSRDRVLELGYNIFRFVWLLLKGDIPMARVKMNAKHEYEYIANFKIMQTAFKTKRIDKVRSYIK